VTTADTATTIEQVRAMARQVRLDVLEMTHRSGASHVGTCFSIADIIATLYGTVLRVDPEAPGWPERDRFILSKGHGCAALYSALVQRGFFPRERLDGFYADGGSLFGHITHKGVPGVEASTGSLGHGLPIASGMALWAARRGQSHRVVALLSDGECDEGSTWEAAMFAGHHRLAQLTAIVDYNHIQSLTSTDDTVSLEPLDDRWRSFGWEARVVDGHDLEALLTALTEPSREGRPIAVIARTTKGRGVSFMEHQVLWHYRAPDADEYARARRELESQ
jgi:transketolase